MLIGQTQTFSDGTYYDEYRIGGTSLASPLFAGFTALSLQKAKHRVGLLNPTIYKAKAAFTDVTAAFPDAGNVRVNYTNSENAMTACPTSSARSATRTARCWSRRATTT